MELGLDGSAAFVAGASSGLGKACADALLGCGARVAICSRSEDRIAEAAESLRAAHPGATVLPLACDVTDEAQLASALRKTADAFGGLHVLVTNAGGPPAGTIDDFDASDWEKALQLNLMSTINLSRHALPHLKRTAERDGWGRIIMISSLSAKQPIPTLYLSNVSRAGVQGFAKSLSEEVGALGITVNTVLPGYTRTDRLRHLSDALSERTGKSVDEVEAGWAESSALKRIGTEEEFGATVAFLASRPAGYITGVGLPIDGGAVKSLL
ncbi:MAG: SDR family oxidoreductase [Rhodothermales bacterium]|nr:SDR family oxidoreductase [Rhodothermales bacterium]MBO6779533.1 SDR family oxidoreductase [Rhodothermales bacterium]